MEQARRRGVIVVRAAVELSRLSVRLVWNLFNWSLVDVNSGGG